MKNRYTLLIILAFAYTLSRLTAFGQISITSEYTIENQTSTGNFTYIPKSVIPFAKVHPTIWFCLQ